MRASIIVLIVTLAGCTASRPAKRVPFPADQYLPSAAAPSDVRVPAGAVAVPSDPTLRRQVVTAPDGNVYSLTWRNYSESVGGTSSGGLQEAARLPKQGPGFRHIGEHPFGTDETVTYLQFAAWAVSMQYPGTVPVVIGDISDEDGGRLSPHRSHQSGRDADVGFYARGNKSLRWFKDLKDDLDVAKSWVFIEALLRTRAVQYIFIDRYIQEQLYAYALGHGIAEEDLQSIFQYPGGRSGTVIRHVRGHRNHLHVRFTCPADDLDCR